MAGSDPGGLKGEQVVSEFTGINNFFFSFLEEEFQDKKKKKTQGKKNTHREKEMIQLAFPL